MRPVPPAIPPQGPEFSGRPWRELCHRAAGLVTPFYRRYPYAGRMDLFKLDPRGCYSPAEPFFYSRIPKAANTTIVAALASHSSFRPRYRRRQDPKHRFQRPLLLSSREVRRLERDAFVFTFVRNPFSRVLSAYLDKVGRRRHQGRRFLAWAQEHGQPGDFLGFCRFLEAGGLQLDMHWAPQSEILCLPLSRFDLIGRVETLEHDLPEVLERLFGKWNAAPSQRRGTTTNAADQLQEAYGAEQRQIIARLYRRDFELFGYESTLPRP
ncbi:MAG: sulfotransferase family protein [Prochlorococcaceae cyanobacterium]